MLSAVRAQPPQPVMDSPVWILALSFAVLLVLNVPIAIAIAMATLATSVVVMGSLEIAAGTLAQRMATGIDSFSLLAIPFFILSGRLMGQGGIARRLMDLAQAVVGRFPGGLSYVNVLTCMLFGSISGSAAAAVSSVGGFMIPAMNEKGYPREFNVALTTTASTTGLLIPPSNIMIVYALVSGGAVSIGGLFMAGILPGIVFGISLMIAAGVITSGKGHGAESPASLAEIGTAFRRAFWSLLLVVVVLGGILKGIFTATEAAAVAVLYAFFLAVPVYREVRMHQMPRILLESGLTTSVVFLLIATSMGTSWILSLEEIPQKVAGAMLTISDNSLVLLLLINILLLLVGTFMDMTPAVLIFTPIFWPAMAEMGMHPIHFGIMMIANLCIGLCTPPVGTCLFVGCSVGRTSLGEISIALIPFYAALLVSLLLVTYLPGLSLWIPQWLGLA